MTWSVNLSETDSRTMSTEEIVAAYAAGVINAEAFVWKDGMADWVPLLESELAPLLVSAPAQVAAGGGRGGMPVFSSPNQAAQVSRPAATAHQPNTHDLFGSLETAGADEGASSGPSVPQAGTSAYDDGKLTGARNENSVLFSLDALKAGFSPSAPAAKASPKAPGKSGPGAARPQQPSNPDDPFGMSAAAGLMGGGGALFGADNQALINAPAPPPPPVAPAPAAYTAGAMPAPHAAPANSKLVYIVGGIGGVVIIGLLIALLTGKKSDSAATADNSAATSASAAPATVAEKPSEEPKKEESAKPAESASAEPSASAAASAAPSASAAATAKTTGAIGGTAAVKKPKEDAPPPADAPPFSKASAISALTAAASSAGSCKKPGGPTGPGKATVTFAPSGRVTTATVAGGSYAGTAVGGCVASVFRRAHVPAFSGSSVTVSKSFQIN